MTFVRVVETVASLLPLCFAAAVISWVYYAYNILFIYSLDNVALQGTSIGERKRVERVRFQRNN